MLVLSRRRHEKILFPTLGISLEVLRVAGNRVQLGIDAPASVSVYRSELNHRTTRGDPKNEHRKRT